MFVILSGCTSATVRRTDAGTTDARPREAGGPGQDAGTDTGTFDGGPLDGGPSDAGGGRLDSGSDAGGGRVDSGSDAGGGRLDSGSDAGVADAGVDAGVPVCVPLDAGVSGRTCTRASSLFFGVPAREASMLNASFATGTHDAVLDPSRGPDRSPGAGYLSPDGLHYVAGLRGAYPCWDGDTDMGWFAALELVRDHIGDCWSPPPDLLLHCLSHGGHPQLTRDYRAMFGFHGGGHETVYQRRAAFTDRFNPWDGFAFVSVPAWRTSPPDGGIPLGSNQHFTPTPDGQLVAFQSDRSPAAPGDATPRTDDAVQQDIFLARAVRPADPTMGYDSFEALEAAVPPPAGSQSQPLWFSDDGLRLLLSSDRGGPTWDVYLVSRPDLSSPWGTPTRIDALSTPGGDEREATLPSLDALVANGCQGDGFLFRSSLRGQETLRFAVCLGAPCP